MQQWCWRRIEHSLLALDSGGAGRGAAWRPIQTVLATRDSSDWGPQHKATLTSLVVGRQWPQQRLHSAGLVDSSLCQLCLELPGGGQTGALFHRLCCPALVDFRALHMPSWIGEHIDKAGGNLSSDVFLAVTRGLSQPLFYQLGMLTASILFLV